MGPGEPPLPDHVDSSFGRRKNQPETPLLSEVYSRAGGTRLSLGMVPVLALAYLPTRWELGLRSHMGIRNLLKIVPFPV